MAEISLARDFPLSSEADWQALVKEALKGALLSSLRSTSYDGIAIEPLYTRAKDGNVIPGREPGEAWAVMQRVDLPDADANAQILDDLNHAASGIVLVFDGAVGDYGYALPATEAAIEAALKGVHLDWGVPIELDFGPPSRPAAALMASYVKANGLAPRSVNLRFGFDPFGAMATRGVAPKPWSELAPEVTALIGSLAEHGFAGPFAVADGRPVHAAGGSEAQELAFALANAVAYLRAIEAHGIPDGFARRIARNTQTILFEEANLHRVADPAAGSGAIESLTEQLCEKAWTLFQEIEYVGGSFEALKAGLIQKAVGKVRAEREANIAGRKDSVIGTSDFPDLAEEPVALLGAAKAPSPGTPAGEPIEPLARIRLAEPFERLRDRSDAYLAHTGERPKVFLACLGRASDFTAHASFAKSLFEAGGIEAVEGSGDNLMKRFKDSGAKLACLCSSDKVYAGEAVNAAEALAAAGATQVYLAGKPGDHKKAWEDAGIGPFLYQGRDTLGLLQNAYERLGA